MPAKCPFEYARKISKLCAGKPFREFQRCRRELYEKCRKQGYI